MMFPEHLVTRWARQRGNDPALIHRGQPITWIELEERVDLTARRLVALGIGEGDRVAFFSHNAVEVVELVHAAPRIGALLVPINARLTAVEVEQQVRRAQVKLVVAHATLHPLGCARLTFEDLASVKPVGRYRALAPDSTRPLAAIFTSGTTGVPKAAVLSLGNMVASAVASALHLGTQLDDRWLLCLPLFHVGGLSIVIRAALVGGAIVLHERFDAGAVLRALREDGVTQLSLVPTSLARLLEVEPRGESLRTLRALLIGGAPLPGPLEERCRALGIPALATYGLTEAASQVTTVRPDDRGSPGSGHPLPFTAVRVVGAARRPLGPGEVGEIEVSGPTVMQGYLDDPPATAHALDQGWLRTFDLGSLDGQGRLTVHARRSDLILSGGENVYPAEVEAALLGAEGLREAAVVGLDDETWGQVPAAAVVLGPGATVEVARARCDAVLAGFKRPRQIVVLDALPRTGSGKVDRVRLRALLDERLQRR